VNSETNTPKYRALKFGVTRVAVREANGHTYLSAVQALEPFADRLTDRLLHWAEQAPDRTFIARRVANVDGSRGDWRQVTYREALSAARSIGQALLDSGASVERPLAILSENSIEHALLALGALLVGVPYCSVSTAYSLVSQDYDKLNHVVGTLTPGVVYVSDLTRYGNAVDAVIPTETLVVIGARGERARKAGTTVTLDAWLATKPTNAVDIAMHATGPDSIAKFLFTSGSTKLPKAVVNTNRMWCSNQQQMRQSMPVLADTPPVLVDWLPWNHTFGGNHNFGLTVYNGGTLYIDDGKPTPALMAETLRNLREIAPTVYFNVPTGFEAIANAMHTDAALRKNLLSRVQMFFYAGAALAQPVWDSLFAHAENEVGERIVMTTGLGMTESGPFAIFVSSHDVKAGDLGVPTPGMELKLVASGDKTEVRYKGPNITPGYWRNDEAARGAFDDEGFFCTGDAIKWIDHADVHKGIRFDGRIAEDFKLSTGTFVSVGPLRAKITGVGAPYVQDAVITGINLREVGAMIFPLVPAVRKLSGLPDNATLAEVLASVPVLAHFQTVLNQLAATSTGSASRVARMCLLSDPPSLDKGEVTDKGSINQRAVLAHRAAMVEAFHGETLPNTLKPTA
jgi:feruloyl-CoA synthase